MLLAIALGVMLILGLSVALGTPHAARDVHVAHDCTGITDCYTSVQGAVDAAGVGDLIKVASGIYTGTNSHGGQTQVVYVDETLTVRGGYTVTDWDTSYPFTQPTVLDAGQQGRVIYVTGDVTPTLEGLCLTNGSSTQNGGGIYVEDAHPRISTCNVYSNTAAWGGAGIAVNGSADVVLAGSWIHHNAANSGGGVYVDSSSDVTLSDNHIYSNTAQMTDGGGVYVYKSDAISLMHNYIRHNRATGGGDGGGVYLDSSETTLLGNTVELNQATYGGGLSIVNSDALIEGNRVLGNRAGSEGGIQIVESTITLVNNVVAENEKLGFPCAAGIGVEDSFVTLLHNTIAHNWSPHLLASGVYVAEPDARASVVTLTNNILVSHTVGITVGAGSTATLEATLWGTSTWANEADWGGTGAIVTGTAGNNVWGTPVFVAPDDGDYHLGPESAAIDRGLEIGVAEDIDGDPRWGTPDLGADEFVWKVFLPLVARDQTGSPSNG
jgi:parallel beta-helix repeat protein